MSSATSLNKKQRSCIFPLWSVLWLSVWFLSICCIIYSVCPHSKISLTKLLFYEVSGLCVGECSLDCVIWEEAFPTLTQQSHDMVFVSIRMSSAFRSLINASSKVQFDSFCFFFSLFSWLIFWSPRAACAGVIFAYYSSGAERKHFHNEICLYFLDTVPQKRSGNLAKEKETMNISM